MVGEQRTASIKAKGQIHVKYFRSIVAAMALLSLPAMSASADSSDRTDDPVTMGYVENVYVGKLGLEMKGKLDTGADSSSVFARDVHIYNKSGKDDWVRFRLVGKNGRTVRYDQNVRRFALIKLKKGGTIRRPVIHLPLCIGGVSGLAEVNLADREEFEYDFLVGREFMASRVLVDSASTFIAPGSCETEDRE
ncbi:MAG TPA: hypothetical protein DDX09_02740 [Hyphomonas atlantica]|mgnify:CR=1 FL=1|jgi:hypothetical protein|uniref:Retropepsin-like aspartic endopeptidase domain-containing protein n=1 Tax=Hyphomonas atlantica TaxID=1280948 RepID=A0A353L226_9PROT|nr:hypothetical protein [Hyphomonas atlantica]HBF90061.1 hypothetical protein [Hyphomonas atlantica]HBH43434.1 hypothetical protein [Hyphomonas atlantica]HBQ49212.1 hypothetical protein [Hyphomonas atlantica]|tara:strand:- start:251 stop:829 length:579 start_codon:yes stop_codon:yes gene_type:complete